MVAIARLEWQKSRALVLGALVSLAWPPGRAAAQSPPAVGPAAAAGRHDFDFEIGTWTMRRRRLLHPLTGDTTWVDPGPARHIVRRVWGGRASLAELELEAPEPHFAGSILHVQDPQSGRWQLYWASADDGTVSGPMVGSFRAGRGVYEDQEPYRGRTIRVRVVYSDITPTSFRTEQSFSADSGATWQANAVDIYTRVGTGDPATDAVRDATRETARALVATAEAMPAARYAFRPTAAQRTFGEIVRHIHEDDRTTCAAIAGRAPAPEDSVKAGDAKERLVAALRGSLAFCDSALAAAAAAQLGDPVSWYGDTVTRARALVGLAQDWADHYSQLAVYLRLSGIVPPTARASAAGAAGRAGAAGAVGQAGPGARAAGDGSHDFDWDIGTWKTHQRRLLHPLTGSAAWVEYEGTDVVRKLWDGANEGIIEADGPAGHLEIFTLRLYDPDARQWSVYFASPGGTVSKPVVGEFKDGRGEFIDQEAYRGREILVRFAVSGIAADTCHFEQAFSADGGRTWETNFVVSEALVR